ncbi:alpha-glycosidase [Halanaerobacter jeridensis]|uniref:Glycosidase n=1 Tax=Halanaerobacter jeridensis TaxID=706427 RepID=A0A938XQY8_9FIRM|nr:alpha-glycosidase [Halanaerobacter jeridensis]MBM7556049.1 glycosidase [Halanaerobacter jeridensis]
MLKEAIYHKPNNVFAYPVGADKLFVQLKAKKGDLKQVQLYYDGRFTGWEEERPRYSVEMEKYCSDQLFDYFTAEISYEHKKFDYYFLLDDGVNKLYYTNYGFYKEIPEEKTHFEYTYICEQDYFTTPKWVHNAVFYQIFPERFNNGDSELNSSAVREWSNRKPATDSFYGGDLQGVIEKLDYLAELGIDAIYLTPIFKSHSNHKYNIINYKEIDPQFGDLETLKELVNRAHNKDIKIILDGVFNHSSNHFFAFQDVLENGAESDYADWYYIDGFPIRQNPKINRKLIKQLITELDDLNQINPEIVSQNIIPKLSLANNKSREYILKLAEVLDSSIELSFQKIWEISHTNDELKKIIQPNYETFADGVWKMPKLRTANSEVREYFLDVAQYWIEEADIDGWRLDVADEVDHYFWREFRKKVKEVKADAYIVGEMWNDARPWLRGDQFDGTMNYLVSEAIWDFFCKKEIDASDFEARLTKVKTIYKKQAQLASLNLIDSHDTKRALTIAENNIERLKLAVAFQMSYLGAPMIFYGDEVGIKGEDDPDCRRPMIWEQKQQNQDLLKWYQKLIKIRNENPALRTGKIKIIKVDPAHNIHAFLRAKDANKILVVFNNGHSKVDLEFNLNEFNFNKDTFVDLITNKSYSSINNKLEFTINKSNVMILK